MTSFSRTLSPAARSTAEMLPSEMLSPMGGTLTCTLICRHCSRFQQPPPSCCLEPEHSLRLSKEANMTQWRSCDQPRAAASSWFATALT
jgi:hypothetical protein